MSDQEDDIYEEDNSDFEEDEITDTDSAVQDKDELLNEGVDNSAKEKTNDEEEEEEDFDSEIDTEQAIKKNKHKFFSRSQKITQSEHIKLISEIAERISNSRLLVPVQYEELLECSSGDPILIAKNWVDNRRIVKLPVKIVRSVLGKIPENLNPSSLISYNELGFKDLGW